MSSPTDDEVRFGRALPDPEIARVLGLDPGRVGWALARRCLSSGGKEREEMERRCARHLLADLPPDVPVVPVGDVPVYAVMESRELGANYHRGLWRRTPGGRRSFAMLSTAYPRLINDAARLVRTLRSGGSSLRRLDVVTDPRRSESLLREIAAHPGPWAFDIESFDAAAFPSRDGVATDACHPDFRVRGVAIAWSEDEGAWLELAPLGREIWRPYLDPIFLSPALKGGHNSGFDDDGLVYCGWVSGIANRGFDSMLEWLALSDGRHPGVSLERLVVDVLGEDQWWSSFEKSRMRDAPLDLVANAAVRDAGMALWLHTHAVDRMTASDYWTGQ